MTSMPRELSRQFEFGLALLDSSRANGAGRMPAARPQDAGAPNAGAPNAGAPNAGAPNAGAPVFLFKGCVTEGLFKRVNEATARVLKVNGRDVQVPAAQVCCGALHAHAGDLEGARELARRNIDAFESGANGNSVPAVVTNAGGCGAMLV